MDGSFYLDVGPFPEGYRNTNCFADYVSKFIGRFDWINNAAYVFAMVSGSSVNLLTGNDGALYLLTRTGVIRFSNP